MKSQYLEDFRKDGLLRISRLSYYHNEENLGQVVGDKDEGSCIVSAKVDYFDEKSTNQLPTAMSLMFGNVGPGTVIENCRMENVRVSNPNYFCLCLSEEKSISLMNEFEADSCLEIKNPFKFFKLLSGSIADFDHAIFSRCDYSGRRKQYSMTKHDNSWMNHPIRKGAEYSYQKEVRAVWAINGIKEDHITIKCFEATKYCKFT